jgi:hypothetical protein
MGAATCSQTLLHLLEQQGCDHFKAFGSRNFEFPSSEDVPAPRKIVDQIMKIILRNFWAKSGWEHARKKNADRLAKVGPFDLFMRLILLLCDVYSNVWCFSSFS